ncbi:MAG: ABC transporter substrate-binding protein [Phycisphaerales bacterium]|nr:ABC transporter substrate-binding protein [Phycisphaerales bacterium]
MAVMSLAHADEYDLVIASANPTPVHEELEHAFEHHLRRDVNIRWIENSGGTLFKLIQAADKGGSLGMDVYFGGGVADHELAARRGWLEIADLPPEALAGIPNELGGVPLRDPGGHWHAAALATLGILANRRGLETRGLPVPQSWHDLADPQMRDWIVLADPRSSSSTRTCYELILQHYGWEEGWRILMQTAGNARTISDAGFRLVNEIASGDSLAGPCIDLLGRPRATADGSRLMFIVPPGSTVTPDPISLFRDPPHRALAEQFIAFVLSDEAQKLWLLPPGAAGGPQKHRLFRLPVRPTAYSAEFGDINPFRRTEAGIVHKFDYALHHRRAGLVAELFGAAGVDLHAEVTATWKTIVERGLPPSMIAEFSRPPLAEAQVEQAAQSLQRASDRERRAMRKEWRDFFRSNFDRIAKSPP